MAELVTVVAVIAVIMAAAAPFFLSYLRTSALRSGAEEMATVLNRARQIAIRDNTSMCVTNNATSVQFHVATCGGTVWTGPGTDSSGVITLANAITVSSGQNIVFTYLGTASTAGAYTVTNPRDGRTMSVTVTAAGRVSVGP
ncbi:MAG TPA: GspH/FimT family protein [Methylomirabilota bacterium]|nr:GspH/FimT family protein [Methylomirabilota bacterium]